MPYSPLRSGAGRNAIAQTMMNISNPPPQVQPQGGLPPGMMMAPSPLRGLMGMEGQDPSNFMGGMAGSASPLRPPVAQQPVAPTPTPAGPTPLPQQPVDPSSLFAKPPAVPGQGPPGLFVKPPTFTQ